MAEAYECDRCGSLEEGSPDTALIVEDGWERYQPKGKRRPDEGTPIHAKNTQFDLCPGCMTRLSHWLTDPGNLSPSDLGGNIDD